MYDETNIPPVEPEFQSEPPKTARTQTPLSAFLEHQANAAQETIAALQALLPPEFHTHSTAARDEWLLSFKALFDGATDAIETELKRARNKVDSAIPGDPNDTRTGTGTDKPSTTGKSKVKVEVL